MIKKILPYIFWFYTFMLLIGTVIPWSTQQKVGFGNLSFRLDYWLHFFSYLGITFLFISLKLSQLGNEKKNLAFVKSAWILVLAMSTEIIQLFLPYRSFNLKDFIADASGFFMALSFCLIFRNMIIKIVNSDSTIAA